MIRLPFILAAVALAVLIACGSEATQPAEPTLMPAPTATAEPQSGEGAGEQPTEATASQRAPRLTAADIPPCEGSQRRGRRRLRSRVRGYPGVDQ